LELSEKARIVFDAYDGNRLGGFELAHSIPEWQITVMLSIRPVNIKELKLVSEADYTPHPLQLARIYNHFSETEHLLVESLESPIFLEGLLPLRITQLTVHSVEGMAEHVYSLLADPLQLPLLSRVPKLRFTSEDMRWYDFSNSSKEQAIKGMVARGTIDDLEAGLETFVTMIEESDDESEEESDSDSD
jgi:hypothetical protein